MRLYTLLFIALSGCTCSQTQSTARADNHSSQEDSRPSQEEYEVCVSLESKKIEEIGACHEGLCGVLLTGGDYCTLKLPVKGATVNRCALYGKKFFTPEEHDAYLYKQDSFVKCPKYPTNDEQ